MENLIQKITNKVLGKFNLRLVRLNNNYLAGRVTYNQDGLATIHNADFINDPDFNKAYISGKHTKSWGNSEIHWRAFVACWAAEKAMSIEGDFVECGVNKGGLSKSCIEFTNFDKSSKSFYLLDTFNGLVEDLLTENEVAKGMKGGGYEECYENVCETFSCYRNVQIIRGTIPNTLELVKSKQVAYLSIDMNCVAPEIAAAEFFWDKMSSGGIILLDDYGWPGHVEQKFAFDEFAKRRNVRVLALPTGQGLIFRP